MFTKLPSSFSFLVLSFLLLYFITYLTTPYRIDLEVVGGDETWFYQNLQSRFGIERYAYTESHIGQIPCVCMYVCDQTPPKPLNRFA